jgi:steroid delta-isomerase-like uncharacterized protein
MKTTLTLLEAYYAAFNAQDWEGMLALLTDDVVHDVNQSDSELGKDAFRAFLTQMNRNYQEQLVDLVYLTNSNGARAAAEFVVQGKYLQSGEGLPAAHGQTYRLRCGAFFEIRAGKIARVTNYYNLQDWIRQVQVNTR